MSCKHDFSRWVITRSQGRAVLGMNEGVLMAGHSAFGQWAGECVAWDPSFGPSVIYQRESCSENRARRSLSNRKPGWRPLRLCSSLHMLKWHAIHARQTARLADGLSCRVLEIDP